MRFLALLLAATALLGQEEMIGMRSVTPAEAARYHAVEAAIGCAFEDVHGVDDAVAASRAMLARIDGSGLPPEAGLFLRQALSEAAFAACPDSAALAAALLEERDHEIALDYLLNHGDWHEQPRLRHRLAELLASDDTPDDERTTIAWMFESAQALDDVRETAMNLARDHARPSLAHGIAEAIAAEHEHDDAALRALFTSESRAVREEAMRLAYRCGDDDLLAPLLANAEDAGEPPPVRGTAIEAFAVCDDRPANQRAMLELLDRRHWFYGATGQHFPVHSLALVIPGLAKSNRARLLQLRQELAELPADQRDYVDWILSRALGER